jgi:hypothetical protein
MSEANSPTNFEIRRQNAGIPTMSGILPDAEFPRGTALMISSTDPDTGARTFAKADGSKFHGFVTRDVRDLAGLTDEEQLMGFGLETPFESAKEGSIELGETVDVEGADLVKSSGTGAITTGTALETELSFDDGKFYVAQTNDIVEFKLEAQLTPVTTGNVRIRARKVEGYKKV